MSIGSTIRAGAAYVEVTAETSKLQRNLTSAQAQLQAFGKTCTTVGRDLLMLSGAMAVPLVMAAKSFAGFDDSKGLGGIGLDELLQLTLTELNGRAGLDIVRHGAGHGDAVGTDGGHQGHNAEHPDHQDSTNHDHKGEGTAVLVAFWLKAAGKSAAELFEQIHIKYLRWKCL